MDSATLRDYLRLLSRIKEAPGKTVGLAYDAEVDVLYINFSQPGVAQDSELTDDDVIVRYADDESIGYTIVHASRR